jgi:hypothetical protein
MEEYLELEYSLKQRLRAFFPSTIHFTTTIHIDSNIYFFLLSPHIIIKNTKGKIL